MLGGRICTPCTPLHTPRPRVCKGSTGSDWAESAIALCFSSIGGGRLRSRAACTPCTRLGPNSSWRRTCGSAADTLSAGQLRGVCVGGLSTYTTFLYISRGKGCARCARPGSTFADRPETQRNRSLRRFGADHSFAHPSGQGVCKGVQGCANGCSTHRWWRAGELLRRPSGIDAARRAASIGGTQNRSPGSLERRSGASTRNRLRDSLQVLGGPTGPILGRVCKGVQGCARVCKGCSSTAWPAPSSLSSAKCAQSDSASIGHVTGLSGYAALDLFEWASARSPTM